MPTPCNNPSQTPGYRNCARAFDHEGPCAHEPIESPLVNEKKAPATRKDILDIATLCVTHDRQATHGKPEDNFKTIARYWTSYMSSRYGALIEFTTVDVAAMMVLMKVSRLATSPEHVDHWVDIAGYAACGGEIATTQGPNKT